MKTHLLSFILFLGVVFNFAQAQDYTTVLDQGTETNNEIPVFAYWGYSYSQNIYLASEMTLETQGVPTLINKISFYNVTGHVNSTDNWTVLIGATTKSSFSDGNDWVPFSDLQLVYNGAVTANGPEGWMEIEFDEPFLWDGVSNIVVGVRDQSSGYFGNRIYWGSIDVGVTRSMVISSDYNLPSYESPHQSYSTFSRVPKIKFEHINLIDCEDEAFTDTYLVTVDNNELCDNESFTVSYNDFFNINGLDYQWQVDDNGTWLDLANGDSTVYAGSLSESTNLRLKMTCVANSNEILTEEVAMTIHASPEVGVNFENIAFCEDNPVALFATGADTYSWTPTTGLDTPNSNVVIASPVDVTTYTVTGTTVNGCVGSIDVKVSPIAKVIPQISYDANNLCSAPASTSIEITDLPQLIASADWEYIFMDQDSVVIQNWSTNHSYTLNATTDSVYSIITGVRSTDCPSTIVYSPVKRITVGFGAEVEIVDYNCVNEGGSIVVVDDFGIVSSSVVFENDFSNPANDENLELQGDAFFEDGRAVITPSATSKSGTLIISPVGQVLGNNNAMNVSFDMSLDQKIDNYGTGGADGMSYSFADDILSPASNLQNGRGSKLRLSFDSADNGLNKVGIYLLFGKEPYTNVPTPDNQYTLAFDDDHTDLWRNQTDVPVNFVINEGKFTLYVAGVLIFDQITLPSAYSDADVSVWKHAFSASTGGDAMRHAIKNLNISTGQYEMGLSATNDEPLTWQSGKSFHDLLPGTYHLWMRSNDSGDCQKKVTTFEIVNTNPVVDLGGDYTFCDGDSIVLDAGITDATYVWSNTTLTEQTLTVYNSGVYSVIVTDSIGSSGIGSALVEVNDVPNFTTFDVENHESGAVVFTVPNVGDNHSFEWDFGDGEVNTTTSSTVIHVYETSGDYEVSVKIINDCGEQVLTQTINVVSTVGISEESLKSITIYPNPTNSFFTIELSGAEGANVNVFDVNGQLIKSIEVLNNSQVDVSSWSKGVYFAHISNKNISLTKKIIVQ